MYTYNRILVSIKKKEVLPHVITWVNLKDIMKSEISQRQTNTAWFHLHEVSKIDKLIQKSTLNIHWKDWCWSWSSNMATWCKEPTHRKRPWCWERVRAGGEGGDRGWDGWMASPTQWAWVCANSGTWWRTGKPSVLLPGKQGSPRGHKELNTT